MGSVSQRTVRRRRVFYIPGYDPVHPRRYRELYRSEGQAQAAISGYELNLSPGRDKGLYGWHVEARIEGRQVETDFSVLIWSDIVRDSMAGSILRTYLELARTAWIYVGSGTLGCILRLRKGPAIAALYPVFMLLLQLLVAVLAGGLAGWAVVRGAALLPEIAAGQEAAAAAAGVAAAGLTAIAVLRWFRRQDGRFLAYYLMHNFAYSASLRGRNPPELEARIAAFADEIAAALTTEVDEVLVVGHSSGAHLGASVLADLIRRGAWRADGPALSFLTLGQVMPMVAFLPEAWRLRADLRYLSTRDEIAWVDVTAPGDGCAFALCDPVTVCGVAPEAKKWPLVLSAAFTRALSPERWKALRWRFFRLHFQYLCAFDRPAEYDYFRITAGPQTLGARHAGRKPSRSRIELPVSRFTSVAAA